MLSSFRLSEHYDTSVNHDLVFNFYKSNPLNSVLLFHIASDLAPLELMLL